jgi:hypothetical protein
VEAGGDNKGLLASVCQKPPSDDCGKDSVPGLIIKTRQYLPKMKIHTAKVKPACSRQLLHTFSLLIFIPRP